MVEVEELESGGLSGVVSGRMDEVMELENCGLTGEVEEREGGGGLSGVRLGRV